MTLIFYHKIFDTISVANIFPMKNKGKLNYGYNMYDMQTNLFLIFMTFDLLEINILIIITESNYNYG